MRRLAKIMYQESDSDIVSKPFPHSTRKHMQAGVDTVSPPILIISVHSQQFIVKIRERQRYKTYADCPHQFLQPLEFSWSGGMYCIPISHEDVLQNVLRTIHRLRCGYENVLRFNF